jgi:hypothetical protein
MRISPIVLKLRLANTRFGELVGGSAELAKALTGSLRKDMAFVIPLGEDAVRNEHDSAVEQSMIERFGVIIVLANDISQKDKLGIKAYDLVHDVRNELFGALMNLDLGFELPISYRGGSLINLDSAYLWYQFEFDYTTRISTDPDTGIASVQERTVDDRKQVSQLDDFESIYTQFVLSPSVNLETIKDDPTYNLPISNLSLIDMSTVIDLTDDPRAGAYTGGFASGFDYYDEKRKSKY